MDVAPLVSAVRERLPGHWSAANLFVSRNQGVLLTHPERDEALPPGAEVLRLAQEALDLQLEGKPFELQMRRQEGQWQADCLVEPQIEEVPPWTEESFQTWEAVSEERRLAYEECFGPYPEQVHKVPTLMGFWPGGSLVQLPYHQDELVVTASCGLSNFGLPTPVGVYQGIDHNGQPFPELGPRRRRLAPSGSAGYGYEFLMLTPQLETWPLLVLTRLLEKELLEDTDFLGKVHQYGSVTVDSLPLSPDWVVHVLIAPTEEPLPELVNLSNGTCEFLLVKVITQDELEDALEYGREELLDLLADDELGQISDLECEAIN